MRIGIDCRIAHYTNGGTAVYTRRLTEALLRLPEAADESWLLLEAGGAPDALLKDMPPNSTSRRLRTPSHHLWEQLSLPVELAFEQLDVLHSPDYIPPFARRCHSVITVHDLAFLRWPEMLTRESRAYFNGHIRRAVRSADRIIAVSRTTKQDLMELLDVPPEKVHVVYEASAFDVADVPLSRDAAILPMRVDKMSAPPDLPDDFILVVGTLEPRKNLVRLIEAFAIVKQRGYAGVLVLAGSPGWLAEPTLEVMGQHAAYVFNMPVHLQSLPALYQQARLLALPSLYEGFGIPLLEAMVCGTPILTSNVSSLPEVAGDAALLVDPLSVGAIADGLWRLLTDESLRQDLIARGSARAAQFSWQRAAQETLAIYHQAAASVHSAGTQ